VWRTDPEVPVMARHFLAGLEVLGMRNDDENHKEIYVRDMSGSSLQLFFRHHIYKCQPQFVKSAQGTLYFAPHFTGKAPRFMEERSLLSFSPGISYIARIKDRRVVRRTELAAYLRASHWPNFREAAQEILRHHQKRDVLVLLLDNPQLLFLTPVSKKKLGVHGHFSSQRYTLQRLLEAARQG